MSGLKALDIIKPLASLIPEIELPYERVLFDEKIIYTIGAVVIYQLSSIPLTGVNPLTVADPFYWLRLPFASEKGTLLEFGILPVVTSAFLWQILSGSKFIKVNFNSIVDRQNFQSLQKVFAVLLAVVYAILLCAAGYFKPVDYFVKEGINSSSNLWGNMLIITQLGMATAIVTLLVELLEKGYGFGPGIMAFVAVNSSAKLSGSLFGFLSNHAIAQSHGVFVQLFRNLTSKSIAIAINDVFTRSEEVNFIQVYLGIAVVFLISYLQNFRMEISIKSSKVRSMVSAYPIRLFYCGALPIFFAYTILYNLHIIAFALTKIFGGSPYLAVYQLDPFTNRSYDITSGLLYFLSTSTKGCCLVLKLVRFIAFTSFVTLTSTIFGKKWFAMSGSGGKDLAKQFKEQDIVVVGHRDATVAKELNKMIQSASLIGSAILGLIVGLVEATGLSKGYVAGVVVGVLSALSLLEQIMSKYQQTGAANSQFSQVFGTN